MQDKKQDNYIELKINRDFGDILSVYFDFIRQNLKKFTNIFLNYNGLFLVGLLIVSYLLVSGFIGLISSENSYGIGDTNESSYIYLALGGILYFIIIIVVGVLNYSLAGSYMVNYEKFKGNHFDKKEVWDLVKERLGSSILFVLLLVLIYIGCTVIGIILAIIPLVGIFAYYILIFFILGWFGVSFFSLIKDNKGVTDAYGEGWKLTTKNFWRTVGVNFILGLLNGILTMVVMIIPSIIIGVYTYHVVENSVDLSASIIPTIMYTLGTCLFLIIMVFGQCLSQFVNGILFYSLHEKEYNTNTRSKIEQIGNLD